MKSAYGIGVALCAAVFVFGGGCAVLESMSPSAKPLVDYERAVAMARQHVHAGQCSGTYEGVEAETLTVDVIEFEQSSNLDVVRIVFTLSDRAVRSGRGGHVPTISVYMYGDGSFISCVPGHKSF